MLSQTEAPRRLGAARLWVRRALDIVWPRNCRFCSDPLPETEPGVVCRACFSSAKLIEPPFCRQCASPFAGTVTGETFVCGYCQDLRFYFSRTVCACRAEGVVRDCILRFKYNREMYFGPHLVDWLAGAARRWIDWTTIDAIVPVPLHPRKQRHREFNQAEYLADALSRALAASNKSVAAGFSLRGKNAPVSRVGRDAAVVCGNGAATEDVVSLAPVHVPVLKGAVRRVKDTSTQTKLDAEARARNLRGAFDVRDPKVFKGKRLVLLDDVFTTGATLNSCAKVLRSGGAKEVVALTVARGI